MINALKILMDDLRTALDDVTHYLESPNDALIPRLFDLCQDFSDWLLSFSEWTPNDAELDAAKEYGELLVEYKRHVQAAIQQNRTGTVEIDGERYDIPTLLGEFVEHTDERSDYLDIQVKQRRLNLEVIDRAVPFSEGGMAPTTSNVS